MVDVTHSPLCDCPTCRSQPKVDGTQYRTATALLRLLDVRGNSTGSIWTVRYEVVRAVRTRVTEGKIGEVMAEGTMPLPQWNKMIRKYKGS